MDNSEISQWDSARHPCDHCGDPYDSSETDWWSFQPGLGLARDWAHSACGTAARDSRLVKSLDIELGLSPASHLNTQETWIGLVQVAPGAAQLFQGAGETVALSTFLDSDTLNASLRLARHLRLELTTVLAAPWLIDEEPALLWSTPGSGVAYAVRQRNPLDRCFACGFDIEPREPALDYTALDLGRAHDDCESDARELAWHETSLRWGLEPFAGPWCMHLLGTNPQSGASRQHAEFCTAPSGLGRLLDHARAWTTTPGSPWASIAPAGSLVITSEPYQNESLTQSATMTAGGEPIEVFVYEDLVLYGASESPGLRTSLHMWVAPERRRSA